MYNLDFRSLEAIYRSPNVVASKKKEVLEKIKFIQKMYPLNLSEANRN